MINPPNVVVIVSHDTGRHFGCYGVPTVQTPAIDAFAADGCRFTRMYGTSPICSPSRGSLMTGRWPQRNGLMGLAGGKRGGAFGWDFNDPEQHLSHVLRKAGYETAMIGYHHEAIDLGTLGFDHVVRGAGEQAKFHTAPGVGERCAEFFRQRRGDRPFYLQTGFLETHTPYNGQGIPPDSAKGLWLPPWCRVENPDDAMQAHVAGLQGSVRSLDTGVGIILESLRASGLEDNTLVVFTVDHGPELPRGKWTGYDGGIGVAFVMRWPAGGISGGRTCDAMLSNVDFLPTLKELTGTPLTHAPDGVSFAGLARGTEVESQRHWLGAMFVGLHYEVRTERYKLIHNFRGSYHQPPPGATEHTNPVAELYDLDSDPLEIHNLAYESAHAGARREMSGILRNWLESVDDPILRGPVSGPGVTFGDPDDRYRESLAEYREWTGCQASRS